MNSILAGITLVTVVFTVCLANGQETENSSGGSGNECMCEHCNDGMEDGNGGCVCSDEYVWQKDDCVEPKDSNPSNLDAGEVAGIVIGCVVAVFLFILAFYCFYLKPNESSSHYEMDSQLRHDPLRSSISATSSNSIKEKDAYENDNVFEDDEADKVTSF